MAVSLEDFVNRFPEFEQADATQVETAIAEATEQVDSEVWRNKADLGVKYLAAHLLALSPFGRNARMTKDNKTSTYGTAYKHLQRQVASGYRVV